MSQKLLVIPSSKVYGPIVGASNFMNTFSHWNGVGIISFDMQLHIIMLTKLVVSSFTFEVDKQKFQV